MLDQYNRNGSITLGEPINKGKAQPRDDYSKNDRDQSRGRDYKLPKELEDCLRKYKQELADIKEAIDYSHSTSQKWFRNFVGKRDRNETQDSIREREFDDAIRDLNIKNRWQC